jgi:hypothetical protein
VLIARLPNRYIGSREFCDQNLRMWLQQKGSEPRKFVSSNTLRDPTSVGAWRQRRLCGIPFAYYPFAVFVEKGLSPAVCAERGTS